MFESSGPHPAAFENLKRRSPDDHALVQAARRLSGRVNAQEQGLLERRVRDLVSIYTPESRLPWARADIQEILDKYKVQP